MGDVVTVFGFRSISKKFSSTITETTPATDNNNKNNQNDNDIDAVRENLSAMFSANASWKREWLTGDDMVRRFLKTFPTVVEATEKMVQYFNWRHEESVDDIDPHDPSMEKILAEEGNTVVEGVYDRKGRPILLITPRHHKKNQHPDDLVFKSAVYTLERICQLCDATELKNFCMVYNLEGFTKANMDFTLAQKYFKCLLEYYPERVGVGLIINYPVIVHPFWKIVKVWMNKNMRNKFVFCNKKEFKEYVNPEHIPMSLFNY